MPNELEKPVQKMALPLFTSPRIKAEFVICKIKPKTSSQNDNIRKQVLYVSRVFCYFLLKILYNIFLTTTNTNE